MKLQLSPTRRTGSRIPARASAVTPQGQALIDGVAWLAWRLANPAERERFVESAPPAAAVRVPYTAMDGWRASVLHVPPCAGGTGEPVLIAHALGLLPDAYRYGARATLASRLAEAGFSVYLATWRGDAEAVAPSERADVSFDAIVERDLPALFDAVRTHAKAERLLVIGHGFGGQLAVAHAGRTGGEGLAGLVAIGTAVRFAAPDSAMLRVARVLAHVPGAWRLPTDRVAPALAPWLHARDRVRGVLWHETDGVRAELVRQIDAWYACGALVDASGLFDYTAATRAVRAPLLVAYAPDDALCPEDAALALIRDWGGAGTAIVLPESAGHLDGLFGPRADAETYGPIVRWCAARRDACWSAGGEIRSVSSASPPAASRR